MMFFDILGCSSLAAANPLIFNKKKLEQKENLLPGQINLEDPVQADQIDLNFSQADNEQDKEGLPQENQNNFEESKLGNLNSKKQN